MKSAISIRPAAPHESGVLSELTFRSKAHWGYSDQFMAACRAELTIAEQTISNPRFACRVAQIGDDPAGYYMLDTREPDEFELDALFVDPVWIGQGVGRALMAHAVFLAQDRGAGALVIHADPNARQFYEAAGATCVGQSESGSIPGRFLPVLRIDFAGTKKPGG